MIQIKSVLFSNSFSSPTSLLIANFFTMVDMLYSQVKNGWFLILATALVSYTSVSIVWMSILCVSYIIIVSHLDFRGTEMNEGPLINDHNVWPSLPLSSPSQHKSTPHVVS
jgi:hypothetical protein